MPNEQDTNISMKRIIADSIRRSRGEKVPRPIKWYERGPSNAADRALDAYLSGKYKHGKDRILWFIKWQLWGRWHVHYSTPAETKQHIEEAKRRTLIISRGQSNG